MSMLRGQPVNLIRCATRQLLAAFASSTRMSGQDDWASHLSQVRRRNS